MDAFASTGYIGSPLTWAEVTATCPEGKRVISGGFDQSGFAVWTSRPEGDLSGWIQKLAAERMAGAELASVTADQLQRPTVWAGYNVNVRFRMLRFAGHLVEHDLGLLRDRQAPEFGVVP